MRLALLIAALFMVIAESAVAGEVTLRDAVTDNDGHITLGDLFEGAGSAANLVIAERGNAAAILDAAAVQLAAARAGLSWTNPRGLRRIIVRAGSDGTATPSDSGASSKPDFLVKVGETVTVTWESGGLRLTLDAKAASNAQLGQAVMLINPSSKKTFEAVTTGPGRAVSGPEAPAAKLAANRLPTRP